MLANEYTEFYDRLIKDLRNGLPKSILARDPDFKVRSNRLQIYMDGISGSHYEMCFRRNYHEFALHFESTPERSLERRKAFDPYIDELSIKLNYNVNSGPLENRGWMRVWVQLPPTRPILPMYNKYQDLFQSLIIETYPILESLY